MAIENAIHSQQVYDPTDDSIMREQECCMERLYDYNHTCPSEHAKREQMLEEMLAECGEGCWIEPPFYANWGGKHVHLGDYVYANFGLTGVDDTHIYIGERTMIGPHCTLATANHPIWPELREKAYQYNLPIHIGRNCWLGAGVIVLPGGYHRGQHCDRRRKRCDKGCSRQCCSSRQSLPGAASHQRA